MHTSYTAGIVPTPHTVDVWPFWHCQSHARWCCPLHSAPIADFTAIVALPAKVAANKGNASCRVTSGTLPRKLPTPRFTAYDIQTHCHTSFHHRHTAFQAQRTQRTTYPRTLQWPCRPAAATGRAVLSKHHLPEGPAVVGTCTAA